MTPSETGRKSRTPGRARQRLPGTVYWLIGRSLNAGMEVLTFERNGEKTLPVFSFEEEAEMFLRFGSVGGDWRVRESWVGEIVSVLHGPCAGVKEIALDPLPEMVAERFVDLVSLDRERFIERIMDRRRDLRLRNPDRASPREAEWRSDASWPTVPG